MTLTQLSNDELLSGIHSLVGQSRVILARLLAYLSEIEERRLDLQSACSSLFDFCTRRLGMSEHEACRRVKAARLARRFPIALGMLERGEINLTGFLLLHDRLTEENHGELLRAATGKTKGQVQELLASRFPRPDAPSLIQPLPQPAAQPMRAAPVAQPARVEPLSPDRYKVQFTASAQLREKLERAANLMRHKNPSGELGVIVERALDLLIADLEKRRLAKTKRPTTKLPQKSTRRGYVTRAVRREVFERDGEQCTFVDEAGRRCESRAFLELDHTRPRALGGTDDARNVTLKCRAHNVLAAECAFGREHVEQRKAAKRSYQRQRGYECEMALRALRTMGFKDQDARRAVDVIEERWTGPAPPVETVVREALSVLT